MAREFLGEFEQLVLLGLARAGDQAYAVSIHEAIRQATQRSVSIPAVYVTLSRLEKKGLIASWMGSPSPRRGGRSKRHFRLEPKGVEALKQSRSMLDSLWDGLQLESEQAQGGA